MEVSICGEAIIDLELLRQNTSYGCNQNAKKVKWFWKCLEDYDNYHRTLYLRFVYGRSRLPLTSADFTDKHEICDSYDSIDSMPQSHTCFFQLDIPNYPSYAVLKEKLTYAIIHC